jgi:5-methylcytosine-specific restriction endonuclease McrA
MKSNEFLDKLHDKSIWAFTKQDTNFEQAVNATRLFADVCERDDINIESYFAAHYKDYGINTDRHRMLVIPQFFGLITKTPFYGRGSQYTNERPTEIFDMIKECEFGSEKYNVIKTEQLLKIKIHAIIDTAGNHEGYNILPVLFIYKVLRELKDRHGINSITQEQLYTYIMTCKTYDEVDVAVEYIATNAPTVSAERLAKFKDFSRVLTVIKNNLFLFDVEANSISINPKFDEYFYSNFLLRFDLEALHEQLLRDVDYSYFLYSYQGFGINLIDNPTADKKPITSTKKESYDETKEQEYQEKVDKVKENNVNDDVADKAYKTPPVVVVKTKVATKFERNPLLGKIAIKKTYYTCERNRAHKTFTSKSTLKPYMEAHHLVPIANQKEMWEKYNINIDCVENLVSLCPTCHKAFHYGTNEVKTTIIKELFNKIVHKYSAIGFNIEIGDIEKCYGIKKQN